MERGGDERIARRETRWGGTAGVSDREGTQEHGQEQEGRSMRPTGTGTAAGVEWRDGSGQEGDVCEGCSSEGGGVATEVRDVWERGPRVDGRDATVEEPHARLENWVPENNNTVNTGRVRRSSTGRPAGEQTRRRGMGHGERNRTEGRIRYVEEGKGRGRAPVAQTIVVGRVCVVRTARTGTKRTDAGRPNPDPG